MITRYLLPFAMALASISAHAVDAEDWWDAIAKMQTLACDEHLAALTRGRLVHRDEGRFFALDQQTADDLDLKKLLFPLYADQGGEILGRSRIFTMLRETSVEPEEIRLRREAVRELEDDSSLRFDLRAQLKQMEKWSGTNADTIKFISGSSKKPMSKIRDAIGAGLVTSVIGGATYVAYVSPHTFEKMLYFGAIPAIAGASFLRGLASPLIWHRARHAEIKRAIEISQALRPSLARAKSTRLREIEAVLADFDRRELDSPAQAIVRAYLPLRANAVPGRVLDYSFASALSLRRMNHQLDAHRAQILRLFSALSEAAALSSIATYGVSSPELTEPELLTDETVRIEIAGGHHPHFLKSDANTSVANDVTLAGDAGAHRGLVLTGINGGGKSTVMRLVASLTLMAQMGSRVPARKMRWTPAAVVTNMAVTDSVEDRESFFEAQSERVAEMFKSIANEPKAILIMDEIFTGTSPEERSAGERGILRYLERHPGWTAVLSSHDRRLGEMTKRSSILTNVHVGDIGEPKYVLQPGVSRTRNALAVMTRAGVPPDLLELVAEEMGDLYETEAAR